VLGGGHVHRGGGVGARQAVTGTGARRGEGGACESVS
jgi:hypothetical protein